MMVKVEELDSKDNKAEDTVLTTRTLIQRDRQRRGQADG